MRNKTFKSVAAGAAVVVMIMAGATSVMAAPNTGVQTGKAGVAAMATTKSTMDDDPEVDAEMMIGMPSPIVDYDTLAEAEKAVGFKIKVPATITGYEDISYSVISGELIQAIYRGEAGEICIRKAAGTEEISGDYNVYADTQVVTVRKMDVMIEGDGETAALATWSDGKYAYSVGVYDESGLARTSQGMAVKDMKNLVYVVR